MEKKCYLQEVVGEPNGYMVVENATRKVGTPSMAETCASLAPQRVLKKQKSDEAGVKLRALFQEEPELISDEAYEKQQASSSSSGTSTAKHMKGESESEWMVMLKTLMANQTQELKHAMARRGNASRTSRRSWWPTRRRRRSAAQRWRRGPTPPR